MLALPALRGGMPSKDPLMSMGYAKNPWQNSCYEDCSQHFELITSVERPLCYVSKRKK